MEFTDTKLYTAIANKDAAYTKELLEAGEDPSIINKEGETFLHLAISSKCDTDVVEVLLDRVDLSQRDQTGCTALGLAFKSENPQLYVRPISEYILKTMLEGSNQKMEELVMGGWNAWPVKNIPELRDFDDARVYLFDGVDILPKTRAIHLTVAEGNLRMVKQVLDRKAAATARDGMGMIPLHRAVIKENHDVVNYLLEMFPNTVNEVDNMGRTPLHYAACLEDNANLYNVLKTNQADESIQDKKGNTPDYYKDKTSELQLEKVSQLGFLMLRLPQIETKLRQVHLAILDDTPEVVKEELNEEVYAILPDGSGLSTLHKASLYGRHKMVEDIIEAYPSAMSITDFWSRTPLHYAAVLDDNGEMYEAMAKAGAVEDTPDKCGNSPKHYRENRGEIDLEQVQERAEYLASMAVFQAQVVECHQAVMDGNIRLVTELVTKKRLIQAKDTTGLNMVHKAALYHETEILRHLLKTCPAAVNDKDHLGRTAMHYAAAHKEADMLEILKEASADEEVKDLEGRTAQDYDNNPDLLEMDALKLRILSKPAMALFVPSSIQPRPPTGERPPSARRSRPGSANAGSRPGSANAGSRPGSANAGSRPGSANAGSRPGSANAGSRPGSAADKPEGAGSRPGSGTAGSRPGSANAGSRPGSANAGSRPGSAADKPEGAGSRPGSGTAGSRQGSRPGSGTEKPELTPIEPTGGSRPGSGTAGSRQGSRPGSGGDKPEPTPIDPEEGSRPGSDTAGSRHGSRPGSGGDKPEITPLEPEAGSRPGSGTAGSRQGSRPGSGADKPEITPLEPEAGSRPGSGTAGSRQGSRPGSGADKPEPNPIEPERPTSAASNGPKPSSRPGSGGSKPRSEGSRPGSAGSQTGEPKPVDTTAVPEPTQSPNPELEKNGDSKRIIPSEVKEDPYALKNVASPTTPDAMYVAKVLGSALTRALAEVAEKRPWDPVEYLAHYLYKYADNVNYFCEQEELNKKLEAEREQQELLNERMAKQKEEKQLLKEEQERKEREEQARKEEERKEAEGRAVDQETLREEDEEQLVGTKDEEGRTQLHLEAKVPGSNLKQLLQQGYNLADRDREGRTPKDLARMEGIQPNVDIFDAHVIDLVKSENIERVYQLIMDGYIDQLPDIKGAYGDVQELPEEVEKLIETLPSLKENLEELFKMASDGNLEQLQELCQDRKQFVSAKDEAGRTILHLAVLNKHADVVNHLAENYQQALNCKDNMNRTPLHYAYGIDEALANRLKEAGANQSAKDVLDHVPSYYAGRTEELLNSNTEEQQEPETEQVENEQQQQQPPENEQQQQQAED